MLMPAPHVTAPPGRCRRGQQEPWFRNASLQTLSQGLSTLLSTSGAVQVEGRRERVRVSPLGPSHAHTKAQGPCGSVASRLPTRGASPDRSHHSGVSCWGRGPASYGFFRPGADCCQAMHQGLKHPICVRTRTSHMSTESHDPFPILPDVFLGGTLSLM